jgi:hypothetical protein
MPTDSSSAALTDPANQALTDTSTGTGSSFLSSLGSSLGLGSASQLGSTLGSLAPYAAVAGIGIAQANAGQAQDQQYVSQMENLAQPSLTEAGTLTNAYNTGTLSTADQNVVNTATTQGNALINSANNSGLSQIAQQAFQDYASGTLSPGDQATLDAQVAAQKQQVAQQLASAGITDSTILAAQNQSIDNNALITKQQLLNQQFATGDQAYDQYLTTTQAGQSLILQGQQFASSQLQTYLSNAMAETNIGVGEMNTAITTAMQTDANYSAQVSQLLGTLTAAYAKSQASGSGGGLLGSAANAANAATLGSGSLLSKLTNPTTNTAATNAAVNPDQVGVDPNNPVDSSQYAMSNNAADQLSLNQEMQQQGNDLDLSTSLDNQLSAPPLDVSSDDIDFDLDLGGG